MDLIFGQVNEHPTFVNIKMFNSSLDRIVDLLQENSIECERTFSIRLVFGVTQMESKLASAKSLATLQKPI